MSGTATEYSGLVRLFFVHIFSPAKLIDTYLHDEVIQLLGHLARSGLEVSFDSDGQSDRNKKQQAYHKPASENPLHPQLNLCRYQLDKWTHGMKQRSRLLEVWSHHL